MAEAEPAGEAAATGGLVVEYCPLCTLPPEYCEWGCKVSSKLSIQDKEGGESTEGGKAEGGKGGKGKAKAKAMVTIELTSRNKRKHITAVRGLEAFGIDARAAAKVFGKKFASGAAFEKGKHGQPDAIEIQGDWMADLPDLICQKFPEVSAEQIQTKDSSKNKKGNKGMAPGPEAAGDGDAED